jgi:Ca2+-binding EF-hand superfamily protein
VNFFAKFIKAKVDKKRSIDELKHLANQIDLDKDGIISEHDLEAYLSRLNFSNFF